MFQLTSSVVTKDAISPLVYGESEDLNNLPPTSTISLNQFCFCFFREQLALRMVPFLRTYFTHWMMVTRRIKTKPQELFSPILRRPIAMFAICLAISEGLAILELESLRPTAQQSIITCKEYKRTKRPKLQTNRTVPKDGASRTKICPSPKKVLRFSAPTPRPILSKQIQSRKYLIQQK